MQPRLALLLVMLALALTPAAFAAGKKDNKATISFHVETEGTDNPKMIFPQMISGQQRFFRRVPEISTKDIVSFNPFPSDAGADQYGLVFKLTSRAANRLTAISNANQGRWMIAQVNGRAVDALLIDKTTNDGLLVVWKGITLADIATLDESLPRIGEEGKKN